MSRWGAGGRKEKRNPKSGSGLGLYTDRGWSLHDCFFEVGVFSCSGFAVTMLCIRVKIRSPNKGRIADTTRNGTHGICTCSRYAGTACSEARVHAEESLLSWTFGDVLSLGILLGCGLSLLWGRLLLLGRIGLLLGDVRKRP
jgi:hypothetical protein